MAALQDAAVAFRARLSSVQAKAQGVASARLPAGPEHHYHASTSQPYMAAMGALQQQARQLLVACQAAVRPAANVVPSALPAWADNDDVQDWVTGVLDDAASAVDTALDRHTRGVPTQAVPSAGQATVQSASLSKQAKKGPLAMDTRMATKPQARFQPSVDNSDSLFPHTAPHLPARAPENSTAAAGPFLPANPLLPYVRPPAAGGVAGPPPLLPPALLPGATPTQSHPLQFELDHLTYEPWQLQAEEPIAPRPLDETPLHWVDTPQALQDMMDTLMQCRHVAMDLENHSFRSFQGFTCLMQLSSRTEDWLVDTLELRSHIGPALQPLLANSQVVKVLHGADQDVLWLQRDFQLYIVNMFDTGQAARVLSLPSAGLAHLLQHYCQVEADKRFQLADWRVRPLAPEMLAYAQCDTHYLLYIYDRLKQQLHEAGDSVPPSLAVPLPPLLACPAALSTVLERSRRGCAALYVKEICTEATAEELMTRWQLSLAPVQRAVFWAVLRWRDGVCRQEDEGSGYVLPKAQLINMAKNMPENGKDVLRLAGNHASDVLCRRAHELATVITTTKARALATPPSTTGTEAVTATAAAAPVPRSNTTTVPGQSGPALLAAPVAKSADGSIDAIKETTDAGCAMRVDVQPALAAKAVSKIQRKVPRSGMFGMAACPQPAVPVAGTVEPVGPCVGGGPATRAAQVGQQARASTAQPALQPSEVEVVAAEVVAPAGVVAGGSLEAAGAPAAAEAPAAAACHPAVGGQPATAAGSAAMADLGQPAAAAAAITTAGAGRETSQLTGAAGTAPNQIVRSSSGGGTRTSMFAATLRGTNGTGVQKGATEAAEATTADLARVRMSFSLPFMTMKAPNAGTDQANADAAVKAADGADKGPEPVQRTTAEEVRNVVNALQASGGEQPADIVLGADGQPIDPQAADMQAATEQAAGQEEEDEEQGEAGVAIAKDDRHQGVDCLEFVPMSLTEMKRHNRKRASSETASLASQSKKHASQHLGGGSAGNATTAAAAGNQQPSDTSHPQQDEGSGAGNRSNKRQHGPGSSNGSRGEKRARYVTGLEGREGTGAPAPLPAKAKSLFGSDDESGSGDVSSDNEGEGVAGANEALHVVGKPAQGSRGAAAKGPSLKQRGGRGQQNAKRGGRGAGSAGGRGSKAGARGKPAFNPYDIPDENLIKAGKRSAVMPRSGNRTTTFR